MLNNKNYYFFLRRTLIFQVMNVPVAGIDRASDRSCEVLKEANVDLDAPFGRLSSESDTAGRFLARK